MATRAYCVFIDIARHHTGDKDFPDPRGTQPTHPMAPRIPDVEITHNGDSFCTGGPDGKVHARHTIHRGHMRTQRLPKAMHRPFRDVVQIVIREDASKPIGVFECPACFARRCGKTVRLVFLQ